jgi:hypothetical protein
MLRVDPSRVRALLAEGRLDGQKVGGRWLVAGASVRERGRSPHEPGRRLRPANAWAVLALASGEDAPWVSEHERRRLARLLAARGLARLVGRLDERSRVQRFFAHPGVLGSLQQAPNVVPAGAHAARDQGERLVPGQEADLYVPEPERAELVREFALEPSDQPNAIIRVVPGGLWPFSDRRMPLAAVAVDLAELPDARARRIGRQLIDRLNEL